MIYLLDTNTCIQYINCRNQTVYRRITSLSPDDIAICDVVKFELYFGAYNSFRVEENLETLTTKLQAPKFHKILLTQEFNAAVVQVPRLGILGWQENYLLLGLPLMQALSLGQLKAVVAHELGHLSGNHSRFSAWIYRIRKTWRQIYEHLHQSDHYGALILFHHFLEWYWPAFHAYSFVLARMNEYEADRCAAQLAGASTMAQALINVEIKGYYLESSFWEDIRKQSEHQADPPDNVYSVMLTSLHQPIAQEQRNQWLEQAFARETNNSDTHPCLKDRLNALGYSPHQATKLLQPVAIKTTAAEHLLGQVGSQLTRQFDQDWREAVSTQWRQRYAYLQETKNRLETLEEKIQVQALTEQESWQRAYYTLELQGDEAAIPLLQEVLEKQPNHAAASYTLGQALLRKADAAGVPYIEKAISQRIDWVIEGCELVYWFLTQSGQTEAAEKYHERAKQHYQLLLKAQQERESVSDRDSFKPHSLEPAEVNQITQQVATYPEIKAAYLVEKVMISFPENRFCVLGIVRKRGLIDLVTEDEAVRKLIEQLISKLRFPTQTHLVILNHGNSDKLRRKMSQVPQSLIFRR